MCGIVACCSEKNVDPDIIRRMTDRLRHRGPDAAGIYLHPNARIALGHRRLSVIDLSDAANQPFYSGDRRYVVVFNGEIFNYKSLREELIKNGVHFRTQSDTEVIAEGFAVWGTGMVERLQGMFAIIIVDNTEKKAYAFRDRLGKKPLYYYRSGNLIAFASEIKALLVNPEIAGTGMNTAALGQFLHLGYVPAPSTIYKNIYKFPAGHFGELDVARRTLEIKGYWNADHILDSSRIIDYGEAKNHLQQLLTDAVNARLISDVPLGSFLSGGIDSSLVTAIASRLVNERLKTFSIGFEENRFDESPYAIKVASKLGTDHHNYILKEQEAISMIPEYLAHFDEPFADTSAVPTMLVSRLARQEVTVALTGDGGDELFHGYGAYSWADRLSNPLWRVAGRLGGTVLAKTGNSRWRRISGMFKSPESNHRSHIFSQEQYLFSQNEVRNEVLADKSSFTPFIYDDAVVAGGSVTAGEKQALFDIKYYLPDDLLVKVDRASMYYGLECRSPLLDFRIVEYALKLAPELKKKGATTKLIVRDILGDYLPQALFDRPKRGFSIPLSAWMKGGLREMVDKSLDRRLVEDAGMVNVQYCEQLKKEYFAGMDYLYNRVWALVVLHKWWKENL